MSTLNDGVAVNTYDELINSSQHQMLLFESLKSRVFLFTMDYGCPGMINIETGDRYFGTDVMRFINFPLHRVYLEPYVNNSATA